MPKNPLSDPNQMEAMMEQAKKSMVMMIPQTVIMGWINYFFTGFVLSESAPSMKVIVDTLLNKAQSACLFP
jgi:hypothetical protein